MGRKGKIGIGVLAVIVALLVFLFWPLTSPEPPDAAPVQDYAQALERIAVSDAPEAGPLYPGCESQVMTHGDTTQRAIVLLHGYKSCPLQFAALGESLYDKGYNVYIPRMPRMGLEDAFATEQADLDAAEVLAYVQNAVDAAQGLGEEVTVVGLSAGGGLAIWVAQNRDDVQRVVAISPLIVPGALPDRFVNQAVRVFGVLPNQFQWMNRELKADLPNPDYVYPRNATRVLSEILSVSLAARRDAAQEAPAVPEIVMVTNGYDGVVNKEVVAEVADGWRRNGAANVETYEFPAELELTHDLVAPDHPFQKIDVAYPILIDLITR